MIKVFDRIKELSTSNGVGNLKLEGSVYGYSSFSSVYSSGDLCYYAAVLNNDYEIGSGEYIFNGSESWLSRYPIYSTNGNALVDFGIGVKEIFVTYPAKHSVYTEEVPESGTFAIWTGPNTLSYASGVLQGASGVPGPSGAVGATGATGLTGPSGAIGLTGPSGLSGIPGASGARGATGLTGPSGATGLSGVPGLSGAIGATGPAGSGTGNTFWIFKSSNYVSSHGDHILLSSSGGSFNITLPASPASGSFVKLADAWDLSLNNVTVLRNGSTIESIADDVILDIPFVIYDFIYGSGTWKIYI